MREEDDSFVLHLDLGFPRRFWERSLNAPPHLEIRLDVQPVRGTDTRLSEARVCLRVVGGTGDESRKVLEKMGPQVQWVESYVTDDKIYCVYIAPSEEQVREHARQGGFPANRVSQVKAMIDPTTAEA